MTGFFSRLAIHQTASWYQWFLSRSSGKDDECAKAGCSIPRTLLLTRAVLVSIAVAQTQCLSRLAPLGMKKAGLSPALL